MQYFLKYLTQLSWPAAIVLSVASLALWIPDFLAADAAYGALAATMGLTALNAFVLMVLFYRCGVTRYRVGFPVVSYMLLMAAFPFMHTDWRAQIALLFIAPVVLLLHDVHLNPETQEQSFLATLFVCIGSLFMPEMFWLITMVWLGFVLQQAFSLRTFLASILAIVVYMLYFGVSYALAMHWGYDLLVQLPSLGLTWFGSTTALVDQCRLYVLLAIVVGFSIVLILYIARVSTRVRTFTIVYLLLMIVAVLITFFHPVGDTKNPLPVYAASVLVTLFFQQRESVVRGVIFLVFILLSIASALL